MKMQFDFKKVTNISTQKIGKTLSFVWQKTHVVVFFVFLFSAIAFGGYIWQKSLSESEWSPEKKQAYLDSQEERVLFRENDFRKVIADIQMRKEESAKQHETISDIFKPY